MRGNPGADYPISIVAMSAGRLAGARRFAVLFDRRRVLLSPETGLHSNSFVFHMSGNPESKSSLLDVILRC